MKTSIDQAKQSQIIRSAMNEIIKTSADHYEQEGFTDQQAFAIIAMALEGVTTNLIYSVAMQTKINPFTLFAKFAEHVAALLQHLSVEMPIDGVAAPETPDGAKAGSRVFTTPKRPN